MWDCVDVDRLSPGAPRREGLARYGVPDPSTGINLLTLGRMSRSAAHKGYERLLEVFARVCATVPDVRLVYAGRGDLVNGLRARAKSLGLGARVFFPGSIHEDDLVDVYRAGHIFSLVSDRGFKRGEGLPLALLEAGSCGLPILVGNQDGSLEAVVEGENGFVLDPFDFEAHALRVIRLARDPAERARIGERARAQVVRMFSYRRFVDKHRDLLASWAC